MMILALLLVGVAVGNVASVPADPAPSDAGTGSGGVVGVIDGAEKIVGNLQKQVFKDVGKLEEELGDNGMVGKLEKKVFDNVGKLQKMAVKDVGKLEEEVGELI